MIGIISIALRTFIPGTQPDTPATIGVASNAALNVYAPLFLATRLLAHRKLAITPQGEKVWGMRHLPIVTILLQSAAINVPITIATAIGLGTGKPFGDVLGPIISPSQVCAKIVCVRAEGSWVEEISFRHSRLCLLFIKSPLVGQLISKQGLNLLSHGLKQL